MAMGRLPGLAVALAALGLAACDVHVGPAEVIQGSGNVRTESRDVHGFDAVALSGVGTLAVTQGSSEALTIQAEDNVLPRLRSDVQNGTLQLGPRPATEINVTRPIRYDLTVRQLSSISATGAAAVQASSLSAGQLAVSMTGASHADLGHVTATSLTVVVTGSGEVTVAGQAPVQTVTISGAGRYVASDLASQRATVTVTGAGDCAVQVSDHLAVTITGAGHVGYTGSPTVDEHVTGAGSVTRSG
jgi:hypothetical protein